MHGSFGTMSVVFSVFVAKNRSYTTRIEDILMKLTRVHVNVKENMTVPLFT